jgi:hypothetical protein
MTLSQPVQWPAGDLRHWRCQVAGLLITSDDFADQPEAERRCWLEINTHPARRFASRFTITMNASTPVWQELSNAMAAAAAPLAGELVLAASDGTVEVRAAFGALISATVADGRVRLQFEGTTPGADTLLCRTMEGMWLPQVFGSASFTLPAHFAVELARLDEEVSLTADTLFLTAPVAWPPAGRIQINDELMEYANLPALTSQITGLVRSNPKVHRRGGSVVLLRQSPLWCVADHAATLEEVRAEDALGNVLSLTEEVEVFDGIAATVVRGAMLPVLVRPGRTTTDRESPRSLLYWSFLPETIATNAGDAFAESAPKRGAILSGSGPRIVAEFSQDFAREAHRFDEILAASLSVEFSDSPNWGSSTRLRVRVEKGAAAQEMLFNRDGVLVLRAVEGVALLPDPKSTATPTVTTRLLFEAFEASGDWDNASAVVDGQFTVAALSTGATAGAIECRFLTSRPEMERTLAALHLVAHVVNTGAASTSVELSAEVPGQILQDDSFAVLPSEEKEIRLPITLTNSATAADVFATNARYAIGVEGGASVEIRELWLEAEFELPPNADDRLKDVPSLTLNAVVPGLPLTYNRVELDVLPMMDPADRWAFFSGEGGAVKVTLEVANAPEIAGWALFVRDCHWKQTLRPPATVRPVQKLWGRVRGRCAGADGMASPADVVASLLAIAELRGAPATAILSGAPESALRFSAVFAERRFIGEVMARALAEGQLLLTWGDGTWFLKSATADPEPFPAGELLHSPEDARLTVEEPVAEIATTWIAGGAASFLAYLASLQRPYRRRGKLLADASLLRLPPGEVRQLPDGDVVEIETVRYEQGAIVLQMVSAR